MLTKVLVAAPYFYDKRHGEFARTSSGFGYMVKDILDAIALYNDVYVFTHQFSNGYTESYSVIQHRKIDVVRSLQLKDIYHGMKVSVTSGVHLNDALHYLYYSIDKGAFIHAIDKINPDLIHIHGLTYQTKPFIDACIELNRKFIVTLHGLNGINESVILPVVEKEYERQSLQMFNNLGIPISVVSSGILKKIQNIYKISTNNAYVILNGTNLLPSAHTGRSTEKGKKQEIICVGSISFKKNQTQFIDALSILDNKIKDKIHVTFVGVDSDGIDLGNYIKQAGLCCVAEYVGFVPREEMPSYWNKANFNLVMSKEEGFGLSMIEGFMYGVPTLTFGDLDAIEDIYSPDAFELFKSRSNKDICSGLAKALARTFDKAKIIEWGKQFTMRNVGHEYTRLYDDILRNRNK